jgi:uncharacterized membrane protein
MATLHPHRDSDLYGVHAVPASRPFIWLARGWDDLMHHRWASLAYGVLVAAIGMITIAYERHPYFLAAVISGFLLIGPIMTAGICELSRCQDQGEDTSFQHSLLALGQRRPALLSFASVLFLIAAAWFAVSTSILQGNPGTAAPGIESTVWGDVMAQLNRTQLQAYIVCGAILAVAVFLLSAITVPMIVDRHVSASTAMRMSMKVCFRDAPAMLVWGALIVVLTTIGFLTSLIGMVVLFPLMGHATWYAYRDLVT